LAVKNVFDLASSLLILVSLSAGKTDHRLDGIQSDVGVKALQSLSQTARCLKRRREKAFRLVKAVNKPIGACLFPLNIETAAEETTGLEDAAGFVESSLLIWKGMKPI
jgi:hypothetical protein